MEGTPLLDDCKSGWLMVEKDFSARLFKQEQLKYALQCMGRDPSDKVVSRYWAQCGGSMSYEQFTLVMKRERKTTMRDLMSSFKRIDLNGDGYITAHELHKVLTKRGEKMSHDEVQAIIDEADQNGDGKLDYAEFAHMLLNTSEECVHAAKQKAGQSSKRASISHKKGIPNKHKHRGSVRKSSYDRQKQREDIRAQLFPQGSTNGYHREDRLTSQSPVSLTPSTITQAVSPPHSHLPSLVTQKPVSTTESLLDDTLTSTVTNPQPLLESTELTKTPQIEVQTTKLKAEPPLVESRPTEEAVSSLPDPLELRANSLTKLPPLKRTPLPPLIPPIVTTPQSNLPTQEQQQHEVNNARKEENGEEDPSREQGSEKEAASSEKEPAATEPDEQPKFTEPPGNGSESTPRAGNEDSQQEHKEPSDNTATGDSEGVDGKRQTDHLQNGGSEGARSETAPPASVVSSPPKKPKNIQSWNSITGKGCFYLDLDESPPPNSQDEDGVVHCHHYRLRLPSPTNVWIEVGVAKPGNLATDTLLFVFHTDETEEPTEMIAYTQHRIGESWVCRLDLDAGTYALIPFTSRCYLKPRDDEGAPGMALLSEEGGCVSLSPGCRGALEEVFHRMDLDGNGFISRTEFDFFQEKTSGEICDDEAWKVIQDNFELTGEDELTLGGFLELHVMTGQDEEGGEGELREVLQSLGYSNQLQLDLACPFVFDLFTEDNEGEIEIVDLLPSTPHINPALSRLIRERGVCKAVNEGRGQLDTYTFTTPHMTTIVVENKSDKSASVQLDCSGSANCVFSRDSPLHVLHVPANSTVIGFHIQPLTATESYKIDCIASKILC